MDPRLFKDVKTSRGLTYHYYFSPARDGKPYLVLLHGFPASAQEWHLQVTFFQNKGYGIVAPDLVGYGGTSKPSDPALYRPNHVAKDVVDILDCENITEKVILVGHDWGTAPENEIAFHYADRVHAAVFLSVSPAVEIPAAEAVPTVNKMTKTLLGYELLGYWLFFACTPDAPKICEDNIDNFVNVIWAEDPATWKTDLAGLGALEKLLLSGEVLPAASWLPETDRTAIRERLLKGGLDAPMNWYRVRMMPGLTKHEPKTFAMPVYAALASKDYICLVGSAKSDVPKVCLHPKSVMKEYDAGHWVHVEKSSTINEDILAWIESL